MKATDDAWQQLVEVGEVTRPDPAVFESAREQYLARTAALDENGRPPRQRGRRPVVLVAAAAAAVLAIGITTQIVRAGGDTVPQASESRAPSTTASSAPPVAPRTGKPRPPGPTETFGIGSGNSSLVAYFGEPTFDAFTRTSYVADVVAGTVVGSKSRYLAGGGGDIVTELRLRVDRSRSGKEPGSTITVFRPGGIVAKRLLKDEFESKFGPLPASELAGSVEMRYFGQAPSRVGDRVLVALGAASGALTPMAVATLTATSTGTYSWGATAQMPNPAWSRVLSAQQVDELFEN